jgi:hypothetical protein
MVYIHEDFSKGFYWLELLQPSLRDLNMEFDTFLLIVALIPYESYVGFIRVNHTLLDESTYGAWFSNYVQIQVNFKKDIKISLHPIHFSRAIRQWNKGVILLDNRADM